MMEFPIVRLVLGAAAMGSSRHSSKTENAPWYRCDTRGRSCFPSTSKYLELEQIHDALPQAGEEAALLGGGLGHSFLWKIVE